MIPARSFDPVRDKVGLFSPSSTIEPFPRRTRRAVEQLQGLCRGVVVAPGALGRNGGNSGGAAERARQIMHLLEHEDVGLLMATTGGYGCLSMLDEIDFAAVAAAGKPIVGSSDLTALLLPIMARTGLATFHGPMALPDFGDPARAGFGWRQLADVLSGATELSFPSEYSDAFRFWDRDDDEPAQLKPLPSPVVLRSGSGAGPLHGGNLETIAVLAGGRHAPLPDRALLFLEAAFASYEKIERDLLALEATGTFENASALIFGKPFLMPDGDEGRVPELVARLAGRHRLPCLYGLPLGHFFPVMTLPLGVTARLETNPVRLTLIERAVS